MKKKQICVDFQSKLSGVTHMRQEFTVCQIKSHFSIVCRISLFSQKKKGIKKLKNIFNRYMASTSLPSPAAAALHAALPPLQMPPLTPRCCRQCRVAAAAATLPPRFPTRCRCPQSRASAKLLPPPPSWPPPPPRCHRCAAAAYAAAALPPPPTPRSCQAATAAIAFIFIVIVVAVIVAVFVAIAAASFS